MYYENLAAFMYPTSNVLNHVYTAKPFYTTILFLQNAYKRHSIARPWRHGMNVFCEFLDSRSEILYVALSCCIWDHIIMHHVSMSSTVIIRSRASHVLVYIWVACHLIAQTIIDAVDSNVTANNAVNWNKEQYLFCDISIWGGRSFVG